MIRLDRIDNPVVVAQPFSGIGARNRSRTWRDRWFLAAETAIQAQLQGTFILELYHQGSRQYPQTPLLLLAADAEGRVVAWINGQDTHFMSRAQAARSCNPAADDYFWGQSRPRLRFTRGGTRQVNRLASLKAVQEQHALLWTNGFRFAHLTEVHPDVLGFLRDFLANGPACLPALSDWLEERRFPDQAERIKTVRTLGEAVRVLFLEKF